MSTACNAGRLVGGLILAQMVGGILVNFVLAAPLFGSPGFLVSASAHASQIALSAILGVIVGMISVGIAVTMFLVTHEHARALTLWLLALATACLVANVVEQMNVMSMLSLSEAYVKAPVAEQAGFQGLRGVVAATRNWSHYLGLVIAGSMLLAFYATLYRTALVPRAFAMFGLAAALLQIVAVAMPLFGHSIVFPMLAPLGVSQLVLALWLFARGFRELGITRSGSEA